MDSFIERENEIFDILTSFAKSGIKFVLIGGYAVSAYMHRFSVDADVCIDKMDLALFRDLLQTRHFIPAKRKELEDIYQGAFESFIKKIKLPVTVDLMIGSVASRQTNGSISFETLYTHSVIRKIVGIEKEVTARIPTKELLIALKVHAARLTDARDIVSLCHNIDADTVAKFMKNGDQKKIQDNVRQILSFIKSPSFENSFKGVFSIEKLPHDNIKNAIKLMEKLLSD